MMTMITHDDSVRGKYVRRNKENNNKRMNL